MRSLIAIAIPSGGLMGVEQEAAVLAFMAELEGEYLDTARVERAVGRMASDARYHVHAWEEPFVGHDAIRAEFLRQGAGMSDLRLEILTIGSVGQIVLTERLDSLIVNAKSLTAHVAGVFEVDAAGNIAVWRDEAQRGAQSGNCSQRKDPAAVQSCRAHPKG